MRYMMLVYSNEPPGGLDPAEAAEIAAGHGRVMEDARGRGVLHGAEPLASTATATTVRVNGGQVMVTDGPFAETKEQLAGYYIMECANLDEAIEWAARIPTKCCGADGCIEIRPMRATRERRVSDVAARDAQPVNG